MFICGYGNNQKLQHPSVKLFNPRLCMGSLGLKFEELSASSASNKDLLTEVEQQLEAEKMKIAELSEAMDKWEAEEILLRNRYETLEGYITATTEEAILTSFLTDTRCGNLFAHLSKLVAREVLVDAEQCLKEKDPNF